jgi:hypothetical protein
VLCPGAAAAGPDLPEPPRAAPRHAATRSAGSAGSTGN